MNGRNGAKKLYKSKKMWVAAGLTAATLLGAASVGGNEVSASENEAPVAAASKVVTQSDIAKAQQKLDQTNEDATAAQSDLVKALQSVESSEDALKSANSAKDAADDALQKAVAKQRYEQSQADTLAIKQSKFVELANAANSKAETADAEAKAANDALDSKRAVAQEKADKLLAAKQLLEDSKDNPTLQFVAQSAVDAAYGPNQKAQAELKQAEKVAKEKNEAAQNANFDKQLNNNRLNAANKAVSDQNSILESAKKEVVAAKDKQKQADSDIEAAQKTLDTANVLVDQMRDQVAQTNKAASEAQTTLDSLIEKKAAEDKALATKKKAYSDALSQKRPSVSDSMDTDYVESFTAGNKLMSAIKKANEANAERKAEADAKRGYIDALRHAKPSVEDAMNPNYYDGFRAGQQALQELKGAIDTANDANAKRAADAKRGYIDALRNKKPSVEDAMNDSYVKGHRDGKKALDNLNKAIDAANAANAKRAKDAKRGYIDGLFEKVATQEDSQNADYLNGYNKGQKDLNDLKDAVNGANAANKQRAKDEKRGYVDAFRRVKPSLEDATNDAYVKGFRKGQSARDQLIAAIDAANAANKKRQEEAENGKDNGTTDTDTDKGDKDADKGAKDNNATDSKKNDAKTTNKDAKANKKAAAKAATFPQAGESVNTAAAGVGFVAAMGALFGLAGTSLKKRA